MALEIGIAIAIEIEIEIVSTVALDRMRLANLVASAGETVEQGRDSSIPIPIAISMEAPSLSPPLALCASASQREAITTMMAIHPSAATRQRAYTPPPCRPSSIKPR